MAHTKKSPVMLEVVQEIEIKKGIKLHPGCYHGERERSHAQINGVAQTTSAEYFLELNAAELQGVGVTARSDILTKRFCVSKQVHLGQIAIR